MGLIEDLRRKGRAQYLEQFTSEQLRQAEESLKKMNEDWAKEKHEKAKEYYVLSGISEMLELLVQHNGYSVTLHGLEENSKADEIEIHLEKEIITDISGAPGFGWLDTLSVETQSIEVNFSWFGRIEFLGGSGPIGPRMYFDEKVSLYFEKWKNSPKLIEGALENVLAYPKKFFTRIPKPGIFHGGSGNGEPGIAPGLPR